MGHDHGHEHGLGHSHGPANYNRPFAIGVGLNLGFVVIEAVYGVLADSLALIADAGHNLSDVVSLLLAWGASLLAARAASDKRTYGFRKATVMASLVSAALLVVALGAIAWEAVGRLQQPQPIAGMTVILVAGVGVVINTLTALLFMKGQRDDLNIRAAFLHMAADAAVSLGVVIAGLVIVAEGWLWVDPVISLVIVAVIFAGTWRLLLDSINYAMDAVPDKIDLAAIQRLLLGQQRVDSIHDLHVWPLSTSEVALTVHLVVADERLDNQFLHRLQHRLHDEFGIEHATIQVETATGPRDCLLDGDRNGHPGCR